MLTNVFNINLMNSSSVSSEPFISKIMNNINNLLNIKENFNITNLVDNMDDKVLNKDLLEEVSKKVVKKVVKKVSDNAFEESTNKLKEDMVSHLDSIIETFDNVNDNKKDKDCDNSDEFIYSNYVPDNKDAVVDDYTTRSSSSINNYVEMNLNTGSPKEIPLDSVSKIPNSKTDISTNLYVDNNLNSYDNENNMSGGDMSGLYPFDNEVTNFSGL
jgi:hypothetical protein